MTTNNATNQPELTTNGQLLIGHTASNPSAATLTAGTGVSITNGAGSITISSSNGVSGLVWLASQTASNSPTISFANNLSSTYDNYLVIFEIVKPVTNGVQMNMLLGTGATPTYQTSNYLGTSFDFYNAVQQVLSTSAINLTNSTDMANTHCMGGTLYIGGVNAAGGGEVTVTANLSYFTTQGAGYMISIPVSYTWTGGSAITSLQFAMSSGNISQGIFKLYAYQN